MAVSEVTGGLRVRLDLSDFITDYTQFRWIYLPFKLFCTISDLIDHIRNEYNCESDDIISLFLEEPYCLTSWESINILQNGDIIKVKISQMRRKRKRPQQKENMSSSVEKKSKRKNEPDEVLIEKPSIEKSPSVKTRNELSESDTISSEPASAKPYNKTFTTSSTVTGNVHESNETSNKASRKRKRKRKAKNKNAISCSSVLESENVEASHSAQLKVTESTKAVNNINQSSKEPYEQSSSQVTCEAAILSQDGSTICVKKSKFAGNLNEAPKKPDGSFSKLLNLAETNPVIAVRQKHSVTSPSSQNSHNTATINYDALPTLFRLPIPKESIAFKVLEVQDDYTPGMSNYKTGEIIEVNNGMVSIRVTSSSCNEKRAGKFELDDPDGNDSPQIIEYCWQDILEPKLYLN